MASLENPAVSVTREEKVSQIQAACAKRHVLALIQHATSPLGFVDDRCRRLAWPILLGCDNNSESSVEALDESKQRTLFSARWGALPAHADEHQAALDVNRSFVYYPKGREGDGEKQLASRKDDLGSLITQTLRQHPYLCYFQGYHDIVQVFLLVLGRGPAVEAVARLSVLRIRDFMLPTLAAATTHLHLLPHILRAAEPRLEKHISQTQPYFALSATLTLYAHEIEEYGDIARLFDFFIAHPPSVPVYFFATVIRARKEELLEVEPDEPEMLHAILSKLPKPLDLEKLITETTDLYTNWPPPNLPGRPWQSIDRNSVLKTAEDVRATRDQTLAQGQQWFQMQVLKLRRDELMQKVARSIWAYRRPARSIGIALAVTLVAWWLKREPSVVALSRTTFQSCRDLVGL